MQKAHTLKGVTSKQGSFALEKQDQAGTNKKTQENDSFFNIRRSFLKNRKKNVKQLSLAVDRPIQLFESMINSKKQNKEKVTIGCAPEKSFASKFKKHLKASNIQKLTEKKKKKLSVSIPTVESSSSNINQIWQNLEKVSNPNEVKGAI